MFNRLQLRKKNENQKPKNKKTSKAQEMVQQLMRAYNGHRTAWEWGTLNRFILGALWFLSSLPIQFLDYHLPVIFLVVKIIPTFIILRNKRKKLKARNSFKFFELVFFFFPNIWSTFKLQLVLILHRILITQQVCLTADGKSIQTSG